MLIICYKFMTDITNEITPSCGRWKPMFYLNIKIVFNCPLNVKNQNFFPVDETSKQAFFLKNRKDLMLYAEGLY